MPKDEAENWKESAVAMLLLKYQDRYENQIKDNKKTSKAINEQIKNKGIEQYWKQASVIDFELLMEIVGNTAGDERTSTYLALTIDELLNQQTWDYINPDLTRDLINQLQGAMIFAQRGHARSWESTFQKGAVKAMGSIRVLEEGNVIRKRILSRMKTLFGRRENREEKQEAGRV